MSATVTVTASKIPRFHTDIDNLRSIIVVQSYRLIDGEYVLIHLDPISVLENSNMPDNPVNVHELMQTARNRTLRTITGPEPPARPPTSSATTGQTSTAPITTSSPMQQEPTESPSTPPVRRRLRQMIERRRARRGGIRFSLPQRPPRPQPWRSPPRTSPVVRPPGPALPDSPESPDTSPERPPVVPSPEYRAAPSPPGSPVRAPERPPPPGRRTPAAALGRSPSRPGPNNRPEETRGKPRTRDVGTQLRTYMRERTPPLMAPTRRPENRANHFSLVPSWGKKVALEEETRQEQCVICFREKAHCQIRCRSCGQQRTCCKCIPGVIRNINPCPFCRDLGER